jgi:hypothetical protein
MPTSFLAVASMLLTLRPIPSGQVAVPLPESWPKKLGLAVADVSALVRFRSLDYSVGRAEALRRALLPVVARLGRRLGMVT